MTVKFGEYYFKLLLFYLLLFGGVLGWGGVGWGGLGVEMGAGQYCTHIYKINYE